jgi:hypothetical protein
MSELETERELLRRMERQNALISVALGYIRSDRPEIAAILMADGEAKVPTASEREAA